MLSYMHIWNKKISSINEYISHKIYIEKKMQIETDIKA